MRISRKRLVKEKRQKIIRTPKGTTLDLTKICTRPTREGLMVVERLTGVDLSDVISRPAVDQAFLRWLATKTRCADGHTPAAELYRSFCSWYREYQQDDPPSQKWFGQNLVAAGFRRSRKGESGAVTYEGIVVG